MSVGRAVAVVQVRLGSSRLPGKALLLLKGKPVLQHIIERVRQAPGLNDLIVATTDTAIDDPICDLCRHLGVRLYRGSENDVLDRCYRAALASDARVIVRITADDPCKDPGIIGAALNAFREREPEIDYVSNTLSPGYPDGLDVEVCSLAALETAWREAHLASDREHVTTFIWRQPERFRLFGIAPERDFSHLRVTLDDERDWLVISALYDALYTESKPFGADDVIRFLGEHREIAQLNSGIDKWATYNAQLARDLRAKED